MEKIIIKKEKQLVKIVLVEKHKIKDIIAFQNNNRQFTIDINKLVKHTINGVNFSQSAFNLVYKILAQLMLKHKKPLKIN